MKALPVTTLTALALLLGACAIDGGGALFGGGGAATTDGIEAALSERAYVINLGSDELNVIDLRNMELIASVSTVGDSNHMIAVSPDLERVFVTSSHTDQVIEIDAKSFEILSRTEVGAHPSHMAVTPDGKYLAVMEEQQGATGAVALLDIQTLELSARIDEVNLPHFMRFSQDRSRGYVANLGGDDITVVDMQTQEAVDHLRFDGAQASDGLAQGETGFADAQIDWTGNLYAAHRGSGKIMVYDTVGRRMLPALEVGGEPSVVFAEHPFADAVELAHVVNSGVDRRLSVIDGATRQLLDATLEGDEEVYGVNLSPLAPNYAFAMLRNGSAIHVVDIKRGELVKRISVGGNIETASTTPDGRYIVAAVSGDNSIVVVDVERMEIEKTFDNVGSYPWSVLIPYGQNYCH
ncbi:MAG: SMP-30/gluconolactonase/LRE family protein [Myxococcales bacterium]|nr:SMP-30/gluconolactonase/LRE family protein [Myxococcales bacterium]